MASRKFRFVSPGVFLREIDNSQLPGESNAIGPIIIGRTRKGPGMRPYKIRSLEELERVFGKPLPGNQGSDSWREGTGLLAEAYAPYAAKAYLTAGQGTDSPITMVRLLGVTGDDATSADEANPGWKAKSAYGLFLAAVSGSGAETVIAPSSSFELGAIFYSTDAQFSVRASGKNLSGSAASGSATIIRLPDDKKFNIQLADTRGAIGNNTNKKDVVFNFSEIRKKFNTNPVATNGRISPAAPSGSLQDKYWLGETFDETFNRLDKALQGNANHSMAYVVMELDSNMANLKGTDYEATAARTGWVFGQDVTDHPSAVDLKSNQKLFRVIALQEGSESSAKLMIGIEDIKVAKEGATNRFGTFSVVVRSIGSTRTEVLERFDNCDLDPNSPDFIAKKIGDQYYKWSPSEKRNKVYGEHPNVSEYIRVEMNQALVTQGGPEDTESVPFGFYGPIVIKEKGFDGSDSALVQDSWVTGNVTFEGNTLTASFSWPSMPLVEKASSAQDYYMGTSPSVFSYTTGTISNQSEVGTKLSKAYVDYFRKAPDYETWTTDQVEGIPGNATEHSFIFSLDEVIIEPTSRAASIKNVKRAGDVKSVVYVKGSRSGDDVITPAVAGSKATVDIEVAGYPINDEELAVTDSDGATATFIFKGGVQTADGSKSDGKIIVGLSGLNSFGDLVDRIVAVFAAARGNGDTNIVASNEGGNPAVTLRLTQGTESGSDNANSDVDLSNLNGFQYTNNETTGFAGGVTAAAAVTAYPKFNPSRSYTWHLANGHTGSLETLLDIVDGFHMPLVGGFDGVDITESDPFNAEIIRNSTTADSYAYASIDRALELIKDPEAVEHNVALMPGISEPSLTTKLVNLCEARADSLALIDLPDAYVPPFQDHKDTFQERLPVNGPEDAARNLVSRQINSSYGACYYPWVKIKDEEFNRDVWAPPSVVALGVMAHTERSSEVWFAPAGFNRGGLNAGNAGVPVLQVTEQLLAKDRDTLYAANINPIASFVSEGIVIFGQKTLQTTRSALDRINVRRLLIFVKKEVSRISKDLLFEQNVQATWARFHGQVKTFLSSVKVRFGLTDFKVVLDTTTTTPDLIDRNIMYAKIFLKPARSIEFIAVDFVITNTGASFAD